MRQAELDAEDLLRRLGLAIKQINYLDNQVRQLSEALIRYGNHDETCPVWVPAMFRADHRDYECNCGFADATEPKP